MVKNCINFVNFVTINIFGYYKHSFLLYSNFCTYVHSNVYSNFSRMLNLVLLIVTFRPQCISTSFVKELSFLGNSSVQQRSIISLETSSLDEEESSEDMTITFPSEVEYIETEDRSVAVQYTLGLVLSGTMGFCPFSTKEHSLFQ